MTNYIKQISYELKNQKIVTWVSISGTALAIFMIMSLFMSERLEQLEISPVSQRKRILSGQAIEYIHDQGSGSSIGINYSLAKKLYDNLDGIERYSYIATIWGKNEVGIHNGDLIAAQGMKVDDEYWNIYDYNFIAGKPFDKTEVESGMKNAILTRSTARKIFGEDDVEGREIDVDNIPYIIKGVVEDPYPLLPDGNTELFINYTPSELPDNDDFFGRTNLRLLLKDGVKPQYVKKQVEKRYEDLNRELKEKDGTRVVYHEQPYTSEELIESFGSNNSPKLKTRQRLHALVYVILLLIPAINLSSMTRSRLNSRISEIGVRRAFGAKKRSIIMQIFSENFLMSLIGGIIGLGLSFLFVVFLSGYFMAPQDSIYDGALAPVNVAPVIWHIFDWQTFFIALGACFVLNVMSATIPAWRASDIQPALAIAKTR